MRFFIRLLVLFALAAGLAVGARFNPGNVVFFYPPYRVDLSLNSFLFLLAVLFVLVYFLWRTIVVTTEMPKKVAQYRQAKQERDSNRALREALKALFEGRFGHAEKSATRALDLADNKSLAAIVGARAAHHMSQFERRDAWLKSVEDDNAYKTARLVTTTELLVDQHQHELALEAVQELNAKGKRHIQVLRWALKAHQQAKNWNEVLKLVRILDKHRALHPALSKRLRELSYEALLKEYRYNGEALRRMWNEVPDEERKNSFIAYAAANAFTQCQLHDVARSIVERFLANDWDDRLVRVYREAAAVEGSAALRTQIEHCENWLMKNPTSAELCLTLGSLCFAQKLWGKAQLHMEDALAKTQIEARTVRETNLKLAQLHDQLDQPEQAAKHYRLCAIATSLT